jgi:thioredoxin reductase (NADPH)
MIYDLIIIGAGPAGLTASIYACRHKLSHLVFESGVPGGQIAVATEVENWPGDKSVRGAELAKRMLEQAECLGMEMKPQAVSEIVRDEENGCFACVSGGEKFLCKSVIIAMGAMHRKLGIPGEEKFLGKGVSYCATCDAPFFKGKTVAVIGGGDSAITAAIYLCDYADKVYVIHRRGEFRAQEANQDKARCMKKIGFVMSSAVKELRGGNTLEGALVENTETKQASELKFDGLFVYIGNTPASAIGKRLGVEVDAKSYIKADCAMKTSVPGIFAAGDITGAAPQAIVASGQGAVAAMSAYKFIKGFKDEIAVVNR